MDSRLIDLARNAGKILLSYRGKELNIQNKGGGSFNPVTDADLKANELLQTELSKYYSNDLILSEENTNIPADYSARVWMIDPLDGTSEFIHGGPLFGVHIALCDNGTLQLDSYTLPLPTNSTTPKKTAAPTCKHPSAPSDYMLATLRIYLTRA